MNKTTWSETLLTYLFFPQMVLYDDTSPDSTCEGWPYLTLGATSRTRTEPFPHSWRHNNTHDPVCRWTLTFNELFDIDTQANGDGSLSLFCSYDLFLCKYYEILLLLEIFLGLGSCLIMLVPFSSPVCPNLVSCLVISDPVEVSLVSVFCYSFCLPGHTPVSVWSLCLSLYHLSVFRPFVPPVSLHVCLFLVPVLGSVLLYTLP